MLRRLPSCGRPGDLDGDYLQSQRELLAMFPVSRAVLGGGPLSAILDRIAEQATDVVPGADRASILLIAGNDLRFR